LFEAALSIRDDADIREALAVEHIQQGNPSTAKPIVMRVIQERGADASGVLYLLAEGFQSTGDHEEALRLFDAYAQQFPELAEQHEKQLKRSRQVSERHRTDRAPVASRNIVSGDAADPAQSGLLRRYAPMLTLPAIALGVLVFITVLGFTQPPQHVYIVNGLPVPMKAEVDGKVYNLQPMSHKKIGNTRYGSMQVSPVPGDVAFDPFTANLSANPLMRVFNPPTFVINPDRTALIVLEHVHYAEHVSNAKESKIEVYAAQPFAEFSGVDYWFRESPDEIELENGASSAWRQVVYQIKELTTGEAVGVVSDYVGEDAVEPYLRARAQAMPSDMVTLRMLQYTLPADQLLELLEPVRAERPVLVEAHRIYQDTIEVHDPQRDIAGEYKQLFALEPQSAGLAYLAGRCAASPEEAERFFEQGVLASERDAYLHHGYAFQFMIKGDFTKAETQWRRAMAMDPESPLFQYQHESMKLALGHYPELIEQARLDVRSSEYPDMECYELIKLLAMSGKYAEARAEALKRVDQIANHKDYTQEEMIYWAGMYDVLIAQVKGDVPAVQKAIHEANVQEEWAFTLCTLDGDWAGALQTQLSESGPDAVNCLLIYAGACHAGDTPTADAALELAIEIFAASNYDRRKLAEWLSGDTPPPADLHLRAPMDPEDLRVVLTAFAYRFPMQSAFMLQQARVMDYEPTGYHLALQPMLKR